MSHMGQKSTTRHGRATSALPFKTDIRQHDLHVRLVPKGDITPPLVVTLSLAFRFSHDAIDAYEPNPLGSLHREFLIEKRGRQFAFPNTLSLSVLTRSFAVQPSRSYSAMHFSANCFRRTSVPEAIAPKSA
jgi:hypothetical protein